MLCNSSPSRVLAQWITPHPNTTSQLIKETQTTPAAKPGPKSERAAGPAPRAASSAGNCGTGRALPPQHRWEGVPMWRHLPPQLVPTCSLGSQRQLTINGHISPNHWILWNFYTYTWPSIYILLWLHPPFVFWLSKLLERKKTPSTLNWSVSFLYYTQLLGVGGRAGLRAYQIYITVQTITCNTQNLIL